MTNELTSAEYMAETSGLDVVAAGKDAYGNPYTERGRNGRATHRCEMNARGLCRYLRLSVA